MLITQTRSKCPGLCVCVCGWRGRGKTELTADWDWARVSFAGPCHRVTCRTSYRSKVLFSLSVSEGADPGIAPALFDAAVSIPHFAVVAGWNTHMGRSEQFEVSLCGPSQS